LGLLLSYGLLVLDEILWVGDHDGLFLYQCLAGVLVVVAGFLAKIRQLAFHLD
jgi:hypothetical protein